MKLKTPEELARQLHEKGVIPLITQDRQHIHTSLVAAVEADKRAMGTEINISNEYKLGYRQALDDTLTIINSIFKE